LAASAAPTTGGRSPDCDGEVGIGATVGAAVGKDVGVGMGGGVGVATAVGAGVGDGPGVGVGSGGVGGATVHIGFNWSKPLPLRKRACGGT
jgi:hypothetical protein